MRCSYPNPYPYPILLHRSDMLDPGRALVVMGRFEFFREFLLPLVSAFFSCQINLLPSLPNCDVERFRHEVAKIEQV